MLAKLILVFCFVKSALCLIPLFNDGIRDISFLDPVTQDITLPQFNTEENTWKTFGFSTWLRITSVTNKTAPPHSDPSRHSSIVQLSSDQVHPIFNVRLSPDDLGFSLSEEWRLAFGWTIAGISIFVLVFAAFYLLIMFIVSIFAYFKTRSDTSDGSRPKLSSTQREFMDRRSRATISRKKAKTFYEGISSSTSIKGKKASSKKKGKGEIEMSAVSEGPSRNMGISQI
eukprot:TRINITY_DN24223_c0_g1_i1.p1 TRINITY_DN24223_c0_g1~~TRINITY_DN24223_c0_g1_i1.p1  ORF type:complete len:228 (-),score=29.03 TRINITY_DN24223_c0_g1_i1:40-723(-)